MYPRRERTTGSPNNSSERVTGDPFRMDNGQILHVHFTKSIDQPILFLADEIIEIQD